MKDALKDRIMNCRKILNSKYFKIVYNGSDIAMRDICDFVREKNPDMDYEFFKLELNLDDYSMKIESWDEGYRSGIVENFKDKVVDISSIDYADYLEKLLLDYLYNLCFARVKKTIIDQMVEDRLLSYGVWK